MVGRNKELMTVAVVERIFSSCLDDSTRSMMNTFS